MVERATPTGPVRELVSGTTRHGRQRLGDPQPLSYYHRAGSLGDAVSSLRAPAGARRFGFVGLGVGAAAAHLAPGDRGVFLEIDPAVVRLARARFGYLQSARGEVEVLEGDARALLRTRAERFDLLLVDAFAGDAIPTHLLTREAVRLAMQRVAPQGVLLFHVSNRFFDLRPLLAAAARDLGYELAWRERLRDLASGEDPSRYVALARGADALAPLRARGWRGPRGLPAMDAWTDDHADPLSLWLRAR
ncbi:MAG: fused MFS/spermidine synthase [Polyangiales bacterium]